MNINSMQSFQPINRVDFSAEKMDQRFTEADTDESGSISLQEVQNTAPEGADLERLEKMFNHIDADSDGEITKDEQQQFRDQRAEQAANMQSGNQSGGRGTGDKAMLMLESLAEGQTLNEEQQTKIDSALHNLSDDPSKESVGDALKLIREFLPSVNVTA